MMMIMMMIIMMMMMMGSEPRKLANITIYVNLFYIKSNHGQEVKVKKIFVLLTSHLAAITTITPKVYFFFGRRRRRDNHICSDSVF